MPVVLMEEPCEQVSDKTGQRDIANRKLKRYSSPVCYFTHDILNLLYLLSAAYIKFNSLLVAKVPYFLDAVYCSSRIFTFFLSLICELNRQTVRIICIVLAEKGMFF